MTFQGFILQIHQQLFETMLNQLINVFWTLTSFTVVGVYWGLYFTEKGSLGTLYTIIVLSILVYFIPARWLSALKLGKNRRTYERAGVRFVLWFVQNGTFVNRIQQKVTSRRKLITSRKSALAYLSTISMQERYHYCCFVFFILSALSAIFMGKIVLALLILLSNVVYNVYPILLQQYNRLRINLLLSGSGIPIKTQNKAMLLLS